MIREPAGMRNAGPAWSKPYSPAYGTCPSLGSRMGEKSFPSTYVVRPSFDLTLSGQPSRRRTLVRPSSSTLISSSSPGRAPRRARHRRPSALALRALRTKPPRRRARAAAGWSGARAREARRRTRRARLRVRSPRPPPARSPVASHHDLGNRGRTARHFLPRHRHLREDARTPCDSRSTSLRRRGDVSSEIESPAGGTP